MDLILVPLEERPIHEPLAASFAHASHAEPAPALKLFFINGNTETQGAKSMIERRKHKRNPALLPPPPRRVARATLRLWPKRLASRTCRRQASSIGRLIQFIALSRSVALLNRTSRQNQHALRSRHDPDSGSD